MKTIEVSTASLRTVLQALMGNAHEIRELQVFYQSPKLFPDNPINTLVSEFNTAVAENAKAQGVKAAEPTYEVCECVEYEGNTQAVHLAGDPEGGHYFHTVYRRNPDGTADALQDGELEDLLPWAAAKGPTCYITNDGQRYWLSKEKP